MNAADALEAVINYFFEIKVPDAGERDQICRRLMITYRRRPIWLEKSFPLNKTRRARVEALPSLSPLNFYRAKQIWFQIGLDPLPFVNFGELPLCEEVYRLMKAGETFHHIFKSESLTVGRPRGATSRKSGIIINFPVRSEMERAA